MASCYERAWGGRTCPGVLIVAGPPFFSEKSSFLAVLAYLSFSHCVLTVALLTMALLAMLYAVLGLALLSTPYYSGSSLQPHTASLQPSLQPHAVNLQQYCTLLTPYSLPHTNYP